MYLPATRAIINCAIGAIRPPLTPCSTRNAMSVFADQLRFENRCGFCWAAEFSGIALTTGWRAGTAAAAVARLTSANDFAIQNVERGEQRGGAMSLVVVRLALRQTRP